MALKGWIKRIFGKENITKSDIPVGRISQESVKPLTPKTLDVRYRFINPRYPREWLSVIEKAVVANPILSQTYNLFVSLANAGHEVKVQGNDAEKALKEIENLAVALNTDHLVNQMLSQVVIGGAISVEIVVAEDLSGVERIAFVPVSTIHFAYNPETDEYEPYQWVPGGDPVKLNPRTYRYVPYLTLDGSPYAIPPLLASLSAIETHEEFISELKGLARKVGLMGFLDITFPLLPKAPNETEVEYQNRLRKFLEETASDVEKNINKGILLHFEGTEAEFKEVSANFSGTKEIIELIEKYIIEGAKAQPSLLGFSTGYTETWSSVALHVFVKQLENIQNLVERALEYIYRLHIALKGYNIDDVDVEFYPVPEFQPHKVAEAEKFKAEMIKTLLEAQVITIDEARQMLNLPPLEKNQRGEGGQVDG